MELFIGEKIKKIRHERGLTQEEVALHLMISVQAISKWERGDGYPEITMLPVLSKYFNVSIDELIGMNEITKSENLSKINQLWEENNKKGLNRENALVDFLNGKEKHDIAKEAMTTIFWILSHHLEALAETERNEEYLTKMEKIREILY